MDWLIALLPLMTELARLAAELVRLIREIFEYMSARRDDERSNSR